jgi:hypothetical protein
MKLTGRTILITGGSAGIGLAFALNDRNRLASREFIEIVGRTVFLSIVMLRTKRKTKLAGATGLEPATSCVTGKRSNQLPLISTTASTLESGGGFPAREPPFCITAHVDFAGFSPLQFRDDLFFSRHWPVDGQ